VSGRACSGTSRNFLHLSLQFDDLDLTILNLGLQLPDSFEQAKAGLFLDNEALCKLRRCQLSTNSLIFVLVEGVLELAQLSVQDNGLCLSHFFILDVLNLHIGAVLLRPSFCAHLLKSTQTILRKVSFFVNSTDFLNQVRNVLPLNTEVFLKLLIYLFKDNSLPSQHINLLPQCLVCRERLRVLLVCLVQTIFNHFDLLAKLGRSFL